MATTRGPVWMGVKAFSLAIAVAFAPHSGAVDASRCYSPRADAPVKTTMRERISSFVERTTAAATGLGLDSLLDDALDHANAAVEGGAGTGYDSTDALETFMTDMRSADIKRAQSVSAAEDTTDDHCASFVPVCYTSGGTTACTACTAE